MRQRFAAAEFINARQLELGVDIQLSQNLRIPGKYIAKAGQIAHRGFRQRHATGVAAGAVAEMAGFEKGYRIFRSEAFEPRGRRKSREAAADYGEIDRPRLRLGLGVKFDCPGTVAPIFGWHDPVDSSHFQCTLCAWPALRNDRNERPSGKRKPRGGRREALKNGSGI